MATESRRVERSQAALDKIGADYTITNIVDLSASEADQKYLEGTGVLTILTSWSTLACQSVATRSCCARIPSSWGYTPVVFHSYDTRGGAVYHTNVMMGVQSITAAVCAESVTNATECNDLLQSLQTTGHTVVQITQAQMSAFCGNVLEVQNQDGEKFLVMSQTAYDTFTSEQREILGQDKTLLPISIPTIETIGGGSVQCMLGENFLPPNSLA